MDIIKSESLRLPFQLSSAARISKKKKRKIKPKSLFQEPPARTERLRELQRRGERREGGGSGGCFFSLASFFFFFFSQELPATRSAFNYRWRMMLALFLSVMSCTCKLQNILESHRCPLISSPLVLPSSAKSGVIHLQCTGGRPQGSAA